MVNVETSRQRSWWERVAESHYRASLPRLVNDMQHESAGVYQSLVGDLGTPLEADFEREVARQMNAGRRGGIRPSRVLLPEMMRRFGCAAAEVEMAPMRSTCDACPVSGRCWRALRQGADAEECRSFCANAEVFESKACESRAS